MYEIKFSPDQFNCIQLTIFILFLSEFSSLIGFKGVNQFNFDLVHNTLNVIKLIFDLVPFILSVSLMEFYIPADIIFLNKQIQ